MDLLTRIEELILLTVWKLQDEAYGLSIRKKISDLTGTEMSVGAVYVPLKRLKKNGYLDSQDADPVDKRGGRSKRFYTLTPKGVAALAHVRTVQEKAWANLPDLGFEIAPLNS